MLYLYSTPIEGHDLLCAVCEAVKALLMGHPSIKLCQLKVEIVNHGTDHCSRKIQLRYLANRWDDSNGHFVKIFLNDILET